MILDNTLLWTNQKVNALSKTGEDGYTVLDEIPKAINEGIRPGHRIMLGAVIVDTDIKVLING